MPNQDLPPHKPLATFRHQWLELCHHALALGREGLEVAGLFRDPRRLQNLWLAESGRTVDRYIRSPAFLGLMQHNLKAMARPTFLSSALGTK